VTTAATKNLFARAMKAPVRVEGDLAARVGEQLRNSLLSALSLARKSGALVAGFDAVEAAVRSGRVAAMIHAAEAGSDGVGKLQSLLARQSRPSHQIPLLRRLTGAELSLALGRPNVIHAALLAGRASHHALDQINQFARFTNEPPSDDTSFSTKPADPTVEQQGI
jgi:ribosomal protein L7Ae-like RNA K-turn-binding protein